jgi:predicted DCC family thiol-disulfide oxidoreductase YuxK
MGPDHQVILFDGVCNLCNASVQFVIRHDKKARFRFAALQSAYGAEQLKKYSLPEKEFDSIVLIKNGIHTKSDAALEIARDLSGAWPVMYGFKIVPRFVRNWIYDWIARNRYRFFGRQDHCMIPTKELRERFYA